MGSLVDSGAENRGLNSPTFAAPRKWESPPPAKTAKNQFQLTSEGNTAWIS